ncbi:DUF5991 domain-containing protein [Hymenobacter jeollabukensis]|uniref:Uncharacterized protein n=1 Tax=Hymenobacter jeollabukensis TaxID=2025313 RepID=A0A5R8WP91_9BACT|nr:DUF5991 domain-containing protein [Hymenobacter jeollabukensis]TLM91859.1 hypothetical protein FDY95_15000 [Hymenobacter jeollabukensis]
MTTLLLPLAAWSTLFFASPKAAGVANWAGTYLYEEEPVKALAGYSMAMTWKLGLQPQNGALGGQLSVEGQQTFMKLKVRATGTPTDAQVLFVQGLDGARFQQLKSGDVLFRLHKDAKTGRTLTYWGKLQPRLLETYKDGQVAFVRK